MATPKTDLSQTAAGIADLLGGVKSMDDYQSLIYKVNSTKGAREGALGYW